ncbi:hypothetical protein KBC04_04705 [Candidatus Babeliales bacterium]|nr:hypothetical protein [Candidatus Babeliales bacterium]MBP9844120.1 hypothetical protein [Candidatus Babeliales bacterium]
MKDFMLLRWSKFDYYCHIENYASKSNLRFLINFLSDDYRPSDKNVFIRVVNCYNANFVYNDIQNKMFYIGSSEWELDEEIDAPSNEEFPSYVNETNSCKISQNNFIELAIFLIEMKKKTPPFAIIYRDDKDWVHCQGFDSKEEMEQFIQDFQQTVH